MANIGNWSHEEKCAYAAGIVDGEGSIHVARRKGRVSSNGENPIQRALHVKVNMTDMQPPALLYATFGGSFKVENKPTINGLAIYSWVINGKKAQEFLEKIQPWVMAKSGQLELALTFPIGHQGYYTSENDKGKQQEIGDNIRSLNKKLDERKVS